MHPADSTAPAPIQPAILDSAPSSHFGPNEIAAGAEAAVSFLQSLDATGRHNLVAIDPYDPSGSVEGRTFEPGEFNAMRNWIRARSGRKNLYFTANEPCGGLEKPHRKLKKDDIAAIRCVYADVDPDKTKPFHEERQRLSDLVEFLQSHPAPPTWTVDSGGGVQFLWRVDKQPAAEAGERAEAQGRGLRKLLGGDAIQNVDRLFRLPGTLNIPDAKKRAAGRSERPAALLRHVDHRYALDELAALIPPQDGGGLTDQDQQIALVRAAYDEIDMGPVEEGRSLTELPWDVQRKLRSAMSADARLAALWEGDAAALSGTDTTDSAWLANLAARLGGSTVETFDVTEFGTLAAAWPKMADNDKHLSQRALSRAWGNVAAPMIERRRQDEEARQGIIERFFEPMLGAAATAEGPRGPKGSRGLRIVTSLIEPASIPVREYLIEPRLPLGDVCQCVGEPGVSKSTLALRDALAIATGSERILRGETGASPERLHRAGPVLIYNAEDRLAEMERRLAAAQRYFGVATLPHPIYLLSGVDAEPLTIMQRKSSGAPLLRAPGADRLESLIVQSGAIHVSLDPQISLYSGGVENSNDDMNALLQELANLAARHGVSIGVVHHTGKAGRDNHGDMAAGRGGFAAVGKVRSAYTLCRVTGRAEDEKDWAVGDDEDLVRIDFAKVSHGRKPKTPIVLRRFNVSVGNGQGMPAVAAEALFRDSPLERLRAEGDYAPVLDVVDVAARAASSKAASGKEDARKQQIARIVVEAVGEEPRFSLTGYIDLVGEMLRKAGLTKATTKRALMAEVSEALRGDGVVGKINGQDVRVRTYKENPDRANSAWTGIIEPAGTVGTVEAATVGSGWKSVGSSNEKSEAEQSLSVFG
ncbi:AAA family ATPase [Aquibium microcysteis]|uniref:AAA family ATPase n=1 Tax=Aquibium microcysteis TaxID=675281 RepID=UPI00165D2657|nr:AAA family ATPase [Aquibium microcysteis]